MTLMQSYLGNNKAYGGRGLGGGFAENIRPLSVYDELGKALGNGNFPFTMFGATQPNPLSKTLDIPFGNFTSVGSTVPTMVAKRGK